jgi:hypothetical protein
MHNVKRIRFLIILILSIWMISGCTPTQPIQTDTLSIELEPVELLRVNLNLQQGVLLLNGDTQELLAADFAYRPDVQKPEIDYRADDESGNLSIRQPVMSAFGIRNRRGDWTIRLNPDIPLYLSANIGAGFHTIRASHLNLVNLELDLSTGSITTLDLTGYWETPPTVVIAGRGGGVLNLQLPQGMGVQVISPASIRNMDRGSMVLSEGGYQNPLYTNHPNDMEIQLQGSFGEVNFIAGYVRDMPVSVAVDMARFMFSKEGAFSCSSNPYNERLSTETVTDLWYDYLCERGPHQRTFTGSDSLTIELAQSELLDQIRRQYYSGQPLDQSTLYFNIPEFFSASTDMLLLLQQRERLEFSITHFIGSFDYSVTVDGDRLQFEIQNQTDRSSGTHIPTRFPEEGYTETLEHLMQINPAIGDTFLFELISSAKYPIIAVLDTKTREETTGDEGGGVFEQIFTWTERLTDYADLPAWPQYVDELDIQ